MKKKELLLIFGGRSGEHKVSLRSAASVYKHLDKNRYNIHLLAISEEGRWYRQENPQNSEDSLKISKEAKNEVSLVPMKGFSWEGGFIKPHIVFPMIHGTFGEDGTLQGMLEMGGFPYVGAPVGASYMAMDKDISKTIWKCEGIDVVPWRKIVTGEINDQNREEILDSIVDQLGLPLFVKPSNAGSSVGVSRADSKEELEPAILKALRFDSKVIIEKAIVGREIECAVIGNRITRSFPTGEVAPNHEFYDYEAKYINPQGAGLIIPAKLEEGIDDKIRNIAERAYKALDLRGFSRVDFFLEKGTGKIYLNEVNNIPGFTNISMFSMLCDNGGLAYPQMLDLLIQLGEEQFEERNSLQFNFSS